MCTGIARNSLLSAFVPIEWIPLRAALKTCARHARCRTGRKTEGSNSNCLGIAERDKLPEPAAPGWTRAFAIRWYDPTQENSTDISHDVRTFSARREEGSIQLG